MNEELQITQKGLRVTHARPENEKWPLGGWGRGRGVHSGLSLTR